MQPTQPKRVLCLMDLALVGRASLAVVVPVLAACGVQPVCLPAALFATHTGGFGPVQKQDEAAFCVAALKQFKREGVAFDAVYSGYLCGQAQFALAKAVLAQYPGAFYLADPALADDGRLYSGLNADTVQAMTALCGQARLITPNFTESALLCGEAPDSAPLDDAALKARLRTLSAGRRSVVITSVPTGAGGYITAGCTPQGAVFTLPSNRLPAHYPGTGDTFTAALCGLLLRGAGLQAAVQGAVAFTEAAVRATYKGGGEPRHGLWLEPLLHTLAPGGENFSHG